MFEGAWVNRPRQIAPLSRRGKADAMGDLADCIVVGAGPAGLSASLFLARYRR